MARRRRGVKSLTRNAYSQSNLCMNFLTLHCYKIRKLVGKRSFNMNLNTRTMTNILRDGFDETDGRNLFVERPFVRLK